MKIFSSRSISSAFALISLLLTSNAALAADESMTWSTNVKTHDLDLSTASGAQILQRRLDVAIRSACGPLEFGQPAFVGLDEQVRARNACLSSARAAAVPKTEMLIKRHSTRMASN